MNIYFTFNLLNEYSHGFHYYPFAVKLDRYSNTLDMTDLMKSVLQIKQNLNLSMINMITGINESKTLTNHISCECECKFHGRKCN